MPDDRQLSGSLFTLLSVLRTHQLPLPHSPHPTNPPPLPPQHPHHHHHPPSFPPPSPYPRGFLSGFTAFHLRHKVAEEKKPPCDRLFSSEVSQAPSLKYWRLRQLRPPTWGGGDFRRVFSCTAQPAVYCPPTSDAAGCWNPERLNEDPSPLLTFFVFCYVLCCNAILISFLYYYYYCS